MGPTFNANSCAACYAQPAIGGSSPAVNPQLAFAKLDHPNPDPFPQTVPSFITASGPVREARFVLNPDGSLDGGVHGLFTTPDAPAPLVVRWRSPTSPHNSPIQRGFGLFGGYGQLSRVHEFDSSAHADNVYNLAAERQEPVQQHRLLALPRAITYHCRVDFHRDVQCDLSPLFGFRPPPHGIESSGRHPAGRAGGKIFEFEPNLKVLAPL